MLSLIASLYAASSRAAEIAASLADSSIVSQRRRIWRCCSARKPSGWAQRPRADRSAGGTCTGRIRTIRAERNQCESQGWEDRESSGYSRGIIHVTVEKLVTVVGPNGLTRKVQRKRSHQRSIQGLIWTSRAPNCGYCPASRYLSLIALDTKAEARPSPRKAHGQATRSAAWRRSWPLRTRRPETRGALVRQIGRLESDVRQRPQRG